MFVQMWTPDFKRRGTLPALSGKGIITLNGLGSFEVTVDGQTPPGRGSGRVGGSLSMTSGLARSSTRVSRSRSSGHAPHATR